MIHYLYCSSSQRPHQDQNRIVGETVQTNDLKKKKTHKNIQTSHELFDLPLPLTCSMYTEMPTHSSEHRGWMK